MVLSQILLVKIKIQYWLLIWINFVQLPQSTVDDWPGHDTFLNFKTKLALLPLLTDTESKAYFNWEYSDWDYLLAYFDTVTEGLS